MSGRPREFEDDEVIQAAMDVFWAKGFEAASAQDLVEGTGLGRGSLYNAFGSKLQLYYAALERYQAQGLQAQAQLLKGPGSVKERLRALLQWGITNDLDPRQRCGCMALFAAMERAGQDAQVAQISQRYVVRLEKLLTALFAAGQRRGELSARSPALTLARAFQSGYYGLRVLGRSRCQRKYLEDVKESILSQF